MKSLLGHMLFGKICHSQAHIKMILPLQLFYDARLYLVGEQLC